MIVSPGSDPFWSRSRSSSAGLPFVLLMLLSLRTASAFGADSSEASQSWSCTVRSRIFGISSGFSLALSWRQQSDPGSRGNETFDATLYAGARLWTGLEIWIDPEIDQGFRSWQHVWVAGFPSGKRTNSANRSLIFGCNVCFSARPSRLGRAEHIEPDVNQLGGMRTGSNLVVTAGKISGDGLFRHECLRPRSKAGFFNWAVIDSGAFDYAADACL